MLATDRDALVCDMAETYHILDIWALPVDLLAVLASGLRDNSRIKMKIAGMKYIPLETVLPQVADRLTLIWRSLVGEHEATPMFTDIMLEKHKPKKKAVGFSTPEAYEAEFRRIAGGETNG